MSIPLYGCEAHGGQVITLDDEAVVKDQAALAGTGGSAYAAFVLSTIFDVGLDGGYAKFRRTVQHVHADGAATVVMTPYSDQQESGSTISDTLSIGANPVVTAPVNESGTNFQVKQTVSVFNAAVELGKAQQYVVPRRSAR